MKNLITFIAFIFIINLLSAQSFEVKSIESENEYVKINDLDTIYILSNVEYTIQTSEFDWLISTTHGGGIILLDRPVSKTLYSVIIMDTLSNKVEREVYDPETLDYIETVFEYEKVKSNFNTDQDIFKSTNDRSVIVNANYIYDITSSRKFVNQDEILKILENKLKFGFIEVVYLNNSDLVSR